MKKITLNLLLAILTIVLFANCEGKKNSKAEKTEDGQQLDSQTIHTDEEISVDSNKPEDNITYDSYEFATNLKNDSFFESDNIDKTIDLKNVGITTYFISGDEVSLLGIFYSTEKNIAIPRFENNPPNRSFVPDYFDKKEIKYDEKYKSTYSATLRISLKNPKDVKKLKMFVSSEPVLNYEYKVPGTIDEYRSGFIDLVNVKGTFKGVNPDSPNKNYEIIDAEIN
ncbi:hypothetical protein [Flavobacterium hydrophilum]|uniref:Uncharacterized protein n=1 Tax=Flavobacterium hydrophilum TaxID=2211445 RepID=A0A2V4C1Q8_9FLAO|nr:hypothetical protein [Flavobacterium hydrophilum]PXY45239.1 hypothetical protein DMB68_11145 [Flavobacterium hydrophilum]